MKAETLFWSKISVHKTKEWMNTGGTISNLGKMYLLSIRWEKKFWIIAEMEWIFGLAVDKLHLEIYYSKKMAKKPVC